MQYKKSLAHNIYIVGILHCMLTVIGCTANVFLFPLWVNNFFALDVVRSFSIASLGIMALSDNSGFISMGFIDSGNCVAFFLASIGILLFVFFISVLALRRKNIAQWCILGTYSVDVLFLIYHCIEWPDMLNIAGTPNYVVASTLFRVLGIALMILHLWSASSQSCK